MPRAHGGDEWPVLFGVPEALGPVGKNDWLVAHLAQDEGANPATPTSEIKNLADRCGQPRPNGENLPPAAA